MNIRSFLHNDDTSPTTLSEIKRVHDWVDTKDFFGVYAYATQSGVSFFDLALGANFWESTPSRWLFGIDYGRTQPAALRAMCAKEQSEVRIYDGSWVLDQNRFLPRRDFHAKMSLLLNPGDTRFGLVVGSGNFSANGLRRSIEAGSVFQVEDENKYADTIEQTVTFANELWDNATLAANILDAYEEKWNALYAIGEPEEGAPPEGADHPAGEAFWIEAGYVTKNRGPDRPGNQIDFPRGMSRYFGFNPPDNLPPNSVIGEVTFEPPAGDSVSRNLRLGNNMMEKISLPIPETHGFDIYDGKVLVFQPSGDRFVMHALEADDFDKAFSGRLAGVRIMVSGRRYGRIV